MRLLIERPSYILAQENCGNEKKKIFNKGFITERCLEYSPKCALKVHHPYRWSSPQLAWKSATSGTNFSISQFFSRIRCFATKRHQTRNILHKILYKKILIVEAVKKYYQGFENYFEKFQKVLENFDNHCGEFWDLFHNILRNISENSENYCGKFRKSFQNFREKFRRFQEILRTLSTSISENFEIIWKILKNTSDIFEKYFGKFQELFWKILTIK